MLSILIGHSYFLRFDPKQFDRAKPYPPLATLQVAAQLRGAGHDVALFDAMLAEGPPDFEAMLRDRAPQVVLLYEDNYNYLSKMCLGRMREAAQEMARAARRHGCRVIVAGSDPSDQPDLYLDAGAEAVLIGEGLTTLHALMTRLEANPRESVAAWCDGLEGLAARGLSVPARHPPPTVSDASPATVTSDHAVLWLRDGAAGQPLQARPARTPLDDVAWDLIDIERYRAVWRGAHGRFSLNMAGSKGCSFRCAWCAKPIWGNRYQPREPEAVAAEMLWIRDTLAPDHVWFADDIFGFRAEWVRRFAAALRGGGVPFTIQTRADLITEAMADALRDAGCQEAWIGAESGSQRVLDAMHKGTTVEELHVARRRLGARGIRVGFFIQLGYLGEDIEDLRATRALIEATRPDDIGVSVAYPLPGTPFHDQVKAQLGSKTHWDDSGDLAMMFKGRYTSEFYRAVRDLLHREVRLHPPGAEAAGQDAVGENQLRHERTRLKRAWQVLLGREHRYRTPASGGLQGLAAPGTDQQLPQVRGERARVATAG